MCNLTNNFNNSNYYCYKLNGQYRQHYLTNNAKKMQNIYYNKYNIYYELRSRIFLDELLIRIKNKKADKFFEKKFNEFYDNKLIDGSIILNVEKCPFKKSKILKKK